MISAFKYFGGKNLLARKLVHLIPPHITYVEPFGGSAALLFAKQPSKVEIYNDIHSDLANFFRILKSLEATQVLHENLSYTPVSREEYKEFLAYFKTLPDWIDTAGDLTRAYLWYYIQISSFAGAWGRAWGLSLVQNQAKTFVNTINRLPNLHQRFQHVVVENTDFERVLDNYDSADTFFYLDPPYVPSTRSDSTCNYKDELTDADHERLLEIITSAEFRGKVMLNGYHNPLYDEVLSAWNCIDFEGMPCPSFAKTKKHSTKETHKRTETIWVNYPLEQSLDQMSLF